MGTIPRDELVAAIRDSNRDRLRRSESQLRVMTLPEREQACEFLLDITGRAPLTGPSWTALRVLLRELAFDIYDLTDDPDDPLRITPSPTLVDIFVQARML